MAEDQESGRNDAIVEFRGIMKSFPGVQALDDVSFSINKGEILSLVGENGAGKSTLVKILTGVLHKDAGEILIDGRKVDIKHVSDAIQLGVRCIYQELPLASSLSIADNIFLGQEITKSGFINKQDQYKAVKDFFREYDMEINPNTPVEKLSVSLQQIVAIFKAITADLNILLMDEPTATLGDKETKNLFRFMRRMKEKNLSILYISHRLDEIFEIADRVTVLRDGKYQGTKNISDITKEELITMMSGKDIHDSSLVYDASRTVSEEKILEVEKLSYNEILKDVSFSVHKGEIFGICGLVGAGKTELLKCIYGLFPFESGSICLDGDYITQKSTSQELQNDLIGLVPEDRKNEGLFLDLDVITNVSISNLKDLLRSCFIKKREEFKLVNNIVEDLDVKVSSLKRPARFLSGGNQQKVVFAKWVSAKKRLLMLDEPTRGVDVFGKVEIYKLINKLSRQGMSILISSSEVPEVMGICDRIGIIRQGKMIDILARHEYSKDRIFRDMMAN